MNKPHFVFALCILSIIFSASAGESLFPVIGESYRLLYASRPEGEFLPSEVKIIAKGDGQWVLVEFERTVGSITRRRIITESSPSPDATPTPMPTPTATPKVITQRQWMNFALILAADQKE